MDDGAEDFEIDPAVVPIAEAPTVEFRDWLESLRDREVCDPGLPAAELIREVRDHGDR